MRIVTFHIIIKIKLTANKKILISSKILILLLLEICLINIKYNPYQLIYRNSN